MDPNSSRILLGAAGAGGGLRPGDELEGGYFAGKIQVSGTIYNLIVAPRATGQSTKTYRTSLGVDTPSGTAQNVEYGKLATDAFNDAAHPAFQWAKGLSIGGYTDWYIPAKNELEILYRNLKPSTNTNNASSGANANAVPTATSNYTSGNPAQTSASAFQTGGSEAFFTSLGYLSSSEQPDFPYYNALFQYFSSGAQQATGKTSSRYVRAIRRVAA